jgi:murein DD-endopeptidase MepM/ murein hydrolase activator NlpD
MLSLNRYELPIPKQQLQSIDRTSSPAHLAQLQNAIDFIVDEETPVLAAADGIVTFVKDDSNTGGSNPIYWSLTNYCNHAFKWRILTIRSFKPQ